MLEESNEQGISIHAGFPNPATDLSLGNLDLNRLLITNAASTYMFRVRGTNWEDLEIFDGDIAIVDRALNVRKNDLIIWWGSSSEKFNISTCSQAPIGTSIWGVITSTIHQLRDTASK